MASAQARRVQKLTWFRIGSGEIDKDGAEGKPFFMVAPSIAPTPVAPEEYVTNRLRSMPGYKEMSVGEMVPITVAGLSGYECIATSIHQKSSEPSFIYQVMVFEGSSYWLLVGNARESYRAQYLPVFKRMSRSSQCKYEAITSQDGTAVIEVPSTWTLRSGIDGEADIQAGHAIAEIYAIVLTDAKSDALEGVTFAQYTESCRADYSDDPKSLGDPTPMELNGIKGSQVTFQLADDGLPIT